MAIVDVTYSWTASETQDETSDNVPFACRSLLLKPTLMPNSPLGINHSCDTMSQ